MRLVEWLRRAVAEGAWRMAYGRSLESGRLFEIPFGNGWERGLTLGAGAVDGRGVPAAFACVMSFSRAASQATPSHKRVSSSGKHELVETSPAARLLRYPNSYEAWDGFLFNVIAGMGFDGESLAVIVRDDRQAPVELHRVPRRAWQPVVDPETGGVFYEVAESAAGLYPRTSTGRLAARDVIHFRQYTPRHPLIGETALAAAALAMGINVALSSSQAAFFHNMARPAGILSTDQALSRDQMTRLRTAFEEQSAALAQGKLPILGNGLKFQQLAISSVDAQLIESQRMSDEQICWTLGVPPPVIGITKDATYNNVEQLINHWLAVSLGSLLENIERSLDRAFALPRNEYVELDTNALLRSDLAARIEAFCRGIQGGLYSPDEARELEGLNPVAGGAVPFMQQQMTPLPMLAKIAEKAAAPTPAPAAPAPGPTPPANENKEFDPAVAAGILKARLERARHVA